MRVLSVASECAPLVKTGGLADVVGALPGALALEGVDMRVLLPGYPGVLAQISGRHEVMRVDDLMGGPAGVIATEAAGIRLFVLDAPHLYERQGGPYLGPDGRDWADNPQRFAALCRVAAGIADGATTDWHPDVVHCHDWQAGLTPYYMARRGLATGSVMTIHNMAFQGLAPVEAIAALDLESDDFTADGYEFWGRISALKAGLVWADALSTVSPTYAAELTTPQFGMGLDGLVRRRSERMHGILNGIDETVWDPATDAHAIGYKTPRGKSRATTRLRLELGLPPSDGPLAVVVSRLTEQKGLDLLLEAVPAFLRRGGQLALLGSGDPWLERAWVEAADADPHLAVQIGYDEALSHRMIAGGEAILVPSRFEPCGLTQLYGLRYGTVPVVARTGGLADTVIDANDAALRAGVATGLLHPPGSADALAEALSRLVALHANRDTWARIVRNAMRHPVGWQRSASEYRDLYRSVARHQ